MRNPLIHMLFAAVLTLGVGAACGRSDAAGSRAGAVRTDSAAVAPAISGVADETAAPAGELGTVEPATPSDPGQAAGSPSVPAPVKGSTREAVSANGPAPAAQSAAGSDAAGSNADSAAAEKVLKQAADAYARVRSLQADFVQKLDNPLLGSTTTSRGTIYQRRPDRFLMRFSDPKGDLVVADGQSLWVYYPSVDPDQVMRSRGRAGAMDLQAQFLGDPLARFTPTLEGTEPVGGRPATVLKLDPRVDTGYDLLRILGRPAGPPGPTLRDPRGVRDRSSLRAQRPADESRALRRSVPLRPPFRRDRRGPRLI